MKGLADRIGFAIARPILRSRYNRRKREYTRFLVWCKTLDEKPLILPFEHFEKWWYGNNLNPTKYDVHPEEK